MSSRLHILLLLIGLQFAAPARAIECGPALRKVALLTVAPLTDAEKYIYVTAPPIAMVWSGAPKWAAFGYVGAYMLWKTRLGTKTPSTARGVLNYLTNLRLLNYDFSGKKVVDVGAGYSRFAQLVDALYRGTGTEAVALDKQIQPHGRNSVKADATEMPFKEDHFDLVVSSWAYTYWHGSKMGIDALDEMIRVSKGGGADQAAGPARDRQ
jgi:SAM-dependent methyltransferase